MPLAAAPFSGRAARFGLWSLPVYGVLLGLSTLSHQPPIEDFDAYARYVTTDAFLISHLGASVFGAAMAILGAVAVTAYVVQGRAARTVVIGLVLTTITNVFLSAAFGSASFVQPGIGRAYLNGVPGMPALNDDTAYGAALIATAATSILMLIIAATIIGVAIARTDRRLRWHGTAYAVLLSAFALSGPLLESMQPIAGFAFAAATAALAIRLPQVMAPAPSREDASRSRSRADA